jgi:hypothetical protein
VKPRVDERRLVVRGPGVPPAEVAEHVDAPAHPFGAARPGLVAEGVGQGLGGVRGGDLVAVVVEEGVQHAQAGGAVAPQDRPDGVSKGPARELPGLGVDGRDRGFADGRWPPSLAVGRHRPQLRADEVRLAERLEPRGGDQVDVDLARRCGVQELISADLELEPDRSGQPRPTAVGGEASAGDRRHRPVAVGAEVLAGCGAERLGQASRGDRRDGRRWGVGVGAVSPAGACVVHGG